MKHRTLITAVLTAYLALHTASRTVSPSGQPQTSPVSTQDTSITISKSATSAPRTLRIANWNLQVFGKTKAAKPELMAFYESKVRENDVTSLQEIRDASGTAIQQLCDDIADAYACLVSSRAGRTGSKEQYCFAYNKDIRLVSSKDYNPDSQDRWQRPPFRATFDANGYRFTLYTIHTEPDNATAEIQSLEDIMEEEENRGEVKGNAAALGDLNAGCKYFRHTPDFFSSPRWTWAIGDDADTTSKSTKCAYDRIILNKDMQREYLKTEIVTSGITPAASDHYLVRVELLAKDQ